MSPPATRKLSARDARRLALGAQGFARRPTGLGGVLDRVKLFQLDSVNVVVRAHEMPAYSRLGPYRRGSIEELAYRKRGMFEYWSHVASLLPIELYPLHRWRMAIESQHHTWHAAVKRGAGYIDAVYDEIRERGPLRVSDLSDPGKRSGPWWDHSKGKWALEWLFRIGRVSTSDRRNFERIYDITERVIPEPWLSMPAVPEDEARAELLLRAADAHGVATVVDLLDYFRLNRPKTRPVIKELVADGRLVAVDVEGWDEPGYCLPDAEPPKRVNARALLTPFDPVVWERDRTLRLFGFHYRIEIYVPAPKRIYGYYVMPFLLGDRLVARVDLKADTKGGTLIARAIHIEPDADERVVRPALADELAQLAGWLGLDDVVVEG